jgi:hypothetical protein
MSRRIILTSGEEIALDGPRNVRQISALIKADTLDTVNLRHLGQPRQVMFVDDQGYEKGLPVNEKATALYLANCHPGTTHQILGDVVITLDDDFGGPT